MRNRSEVGRTIDNVLLPYDDCFAWLDYGPAGNPCYDPNSFSSVAEEEEASYTLAAVNLEMKRNSNRYTKLAEKVAAQTGNKYVTYPWLRDTVARILSESSYEELLAMARLSRTVQEGMKKKGLKQLTSIKEALE